MTDYAQDEDPGGRNTGPLWEIFIWKPALSWIFSLNDSHYNRISKPDGSNHQCEGQSCKLNKLESAHSIDYYRGAIDGSCTPAGQHVSMGRHQYSTPTQSYMVSSEGGQPWHDIEQGPQNTSARTQISDIYPSSQQDSMDLEKASEDLGNGEDQLVGGTILPTNWRYDFSSRKHYQDLLDDALISPDSASFAPFVWMTALLEKAILITSPSGRYIGLYPHSADPPIHIKENIPEPPLRLTTHRKYHQRPIRSQKNQLHRQLTSTRSLLAYLLQLSRAFRSIFITLLESIGASRPSPGDPWVYKVRRKKNSHPKHLLIYKMDMPYILGQVDPEWLESYLGDPDFTSFDLQPPNEAPTYHHPTPPQPNIPEHITIQPLDIELQYPPFSLYPLGYPLQPTDALSPDQYITSASESPMDSSMMDLDDLLNLPASPVPTPAEVETYIRSQSEDILPGPATPTMSESVSPQTEGLSTPTFTPIGSSPETVTSPSSPHAHPRRTYFCPEESCGRRQYTRRCDLNKHLKTHKKDLKCQYPGCERYFSTEKDKKRHYQTVHQGQRPFLCDLCEGGKRFSRQDNLKDHRRRIHGVGK